ncbi:MAG: hypothetical protein JRJ20_05260 [Deltaproteobacteria bacterium]|nr:hypothetical protein [Deltaproteobacteria bacterium]
MPVNGKKDREIKVIAYSGYKANERPVYFMLDRNKKTVEEILNRWYGPDHDYFKVLADDGCMYLLKRHRSLDCWYCEEA